MGIIPLDGECFWCIVPYNDEVVICRNGQVIDLEFVDNFNRLSVGEKEEICNKLIESAKKECSDVPDPSKRPICFEV